MDEKMHLDPLQKELIHLDNELPPLKNNDKTLNVLKEFIHNRNISRLYVQSGFKLLSKTALEIVRKLANFSIGYLDARSNQEDFTDVLRKNVFIKIKSSRDVYEGEISDIKTIKDETGNPLWIEVFLKTSKNTKQVSLSKNLINVISNINIGDVVYIEPSIGVVKRLGRSETRTDEYDLEGDKYVQLIKGNVHNVKEKDITLSLYDLDYAFNKYNPGISSFTRINIDKIVQDYISMGIAQIVESGLFIDNSNALCNTNIYEIIEMTAVYPLFKVIVSGDSNLKYERFFVTKLNENENICDIIEYFSKKKMDMDLKCAVSSVITWNNYEIVLNILKISNTANDFINIFNTSIKTI